MIRMTRRSMLATLALAPALPKLLVEPARAAASSAKTRHEGRIVVAIRMMGGNDGLNSVIPIRDDRYYRARPTIAIPKAEAIALEGGDVGLHPSLAGFHELMQNGHAGIVQGVGYPNSSRSHLRATEIWETGAIIDPAPASGWLGRYIEGECACGTTELAGVHLGPSTGRTLASSANNSVLIGNPELLLSLKPASRADERRDSTPARAALESAERAINAASSQLHRARKGTGRRFDYPATEFGQALKWAGNMIETECPTRAYALSLGSFENDAPSFDTHIDQLPRHRTLYTELSQGLRAFAAHLSASGDFKRVIVVTYSDFGRQLPENKTRGTEHGDASVLFYAGGNVRAGLQGTMPDLGVVSNGGLQYGVDFRDIYADVRTNWMGAAADPLLDGDGAGIRITGSSS